MDTGEVDGSLSPTRRWPVWVAGSFAAVALIAAAFAWVAAIGAEGDADDAEAAGAAAGREAAELTGGLAATDDQIEAAESQVEVLDAMFDSGMAQVLGEVYLQVITAGCQQGPGADTDDLIQQVSVDEAPQMLAAHDGWQTAIDHEAINEAVAQCGNDDG